MSALGCRFVWSVAATSALLWAQAPAADAPAPPAATTTDLAALHVHPDAIHLAGGRASGQEWQRVTAIGVTEGGTTVDRTGSVQWHVEPPDLARVVPGADAVLLQGLRDGEGHLLACLGGHEVRVPLVVTDTGVEATPSFRNGVMPILTRAGCNAGSCHGAASGKEGFRLSLFGYDPARDHTMLTRDLRGRRIDTAAPEQSLMLQKASTTVPHKGGKRFAADSPLHDYLQRWIAAGAADDAGTAPALVGIDVLPAEAVLAGPARQLPLLVRARYGDGSTRDVTNLALWSSSNDGTATVTNDGHTTSHDSGEACVLARYGGFAAAAQLVVLADDRPFVWPTVPKGNFVDQHVYRKLQRARIAPAEPCSDEVFLRRVFLDLENTLPTPDETRTFLADTDPDKRTRLVDDLLGRPGFALAQAMLWAEVLQVDADLMEPKGAALLTRWLQQGFAAGRPFDAMVRELLTAEGSSYQSAGAAFHLAANQPHLLAERVAQNFLGVRMQCAQCHNHPFENWSMDDYYGFAAFFAQVGRKRGEDPYEWIVWDRRNGEVRNPRDNGIAAPRFLGGGLAKIADGTDRRAVLADWLCAPDNPFFASNVVNRVWARLFGRGIVDPPDDVRISNPASHPELLRDLAALFTASHCDVRAVYRAICTSRTYQMGRHPDNPRAALFAGNRVRRLSAEQLLDAIGAVTGVATKYPGVPLGQPATAIARGRSGVRFLDVFGRPARESACTCERREEPTLGQTLHLINGDTIAQKVLDANGRLRRALAAKAEPEAMLDDLFLAAFCRLPRADERTRLLAAFPADDAVAVWQDLYWAVLNSKEFTFQH